MKPMKRQKKNGNMIRASIVSMEEFENVYDPLYVIPHNPRWKGRSSDRKKAIFDNIPVNLSSDRLYTFSQNLACVGCGIKGKFFAVEKSSSRSEGHHLNLYAVDSEDDEVLMTKDHIIPKSLGGPETLENFQTMCTICNNKKGNRLAFP